MKIPDSADARARWTDVFGADDRLDSIREQLEDAAARNVGFWLKGDLVRVVDGEETFSDPDVGHQQMWIHPSHRISLIYNRPLNSDPDRLDPE